MTPIPERAKLAMKAMRALEIPSKVTAKVLKKLLKVYEDNWEYIEAENYRALIDAIFDDQENGAESNDAVHGEKPSPSMRTRSRQEDGQQSSLLTNSVMNDEVPPKKIKLEADAYASSHLLQRKGDLGSSASKHTSENYRQILPSGVGSEKQTSNINLQIRNRKVKQLAVETSINSLIIKEPIAEPVTETPLMYEAGNYSSTKVFPESYSSPAYETPLAICPPCSPPENIADYQRGKQNDIPQASNLLQNGSQKQTSSTKCAANGEESHPSSSSGKDSTSMLVAVQEASRIDIASLESGNLKLSLVCSSDQPDFEVIDLDAVFRRVEERCLHSYKIIEPNFSLRYVLQELCQSFLDLCSKPAKNKEDNALKILPNLEQLKKHGAYDHYGGPSQFESSLCSVVSEGSGPSNKNLTFCHKDYGSTVTGRIKDTKHPDIPELSNPSSQNLVILQEPQLPVSGPKPLHDVNDISKGEEKVRITVVNDFGGEKYPPYFNYIPLNIVYQNAYLNFSLARIGDEDCCADCFDDCLAAPIPCACARETGGEFAYTSESLIRKEFLEEYISMHHQPEKHRLFYCKECPLQKSKNEANPEPCKGHPIRKFVKECWRKCGCSMQCGNRVVQRGIRCNLQVFNTHNKGWGVRTLDELPRGFFVCEYVGEVLTNLELYNRNTHMTGNARHTYPILLDADWGSESKLKDEEALCLDATFYGNVGRFINHRCWDANLIEIPVEVETPDHHYYHVAFFTTRKVEAYEELTWDYGIDFEDHEHPVKAFKCRCKSKYCRDRRGRSRAKGKSLVLG